MLYIQSDWALQSLTGLGHLTQIGGSLIVEETSITSVAGLENLRAINDTFSIRFNSALTNLDGLANLSYLGGPLDFVYNEALPASEIAELEARLGR